MSKRKEAKEAVLTVATLHQRIAWLQWRHCYQEANALAELAPFFEPPIRIDEREIERRVAELAAIAERNADPMNWA